MRYATAEQRWLGLRIHATVFFPVLLAVIVINLWLGPPYWSIWVVIGWTIGLVAHWLSVRFHDHGTTEP